MNLSKQIRLFKPSFNQEEINAIKDVFKKPWLGYGPKVKEFEKKFSKFIGSNYTVGLNSCTAALHIALAIHKFKKKKKVLVPCMTFSATAAAILYNDLEPVFVDINKDDLNISFEDLKRKYTKDCVAVMAVHFAGHPCKMDKIVPWAKKKNLIVIEDCAHTCGGTYKNKKLGTWGDFGCFSFEDKKIISTGDGGCIITKNKKYYELLKSFSFHGWSKDPWERHLKRKNDKHWFYEIKNLGFKYNMNNLIAAIATTQLKKLVNLNSDRIKIIQKYLNGTKNLKNFSYPFEFNLTKSCYWLFILKTKKRDKFIKFLKANGISATVHLMPLPYHPIYKKFKANFPNAKETWKQLVSLPLFTDLKLSEISLILKKVKFFDKYYNKF